MIQVNIDLVLLCMIMVGFLYLGFVLGCAITSNSNKFRQFFRDN